MSMSISSSSVEIEAVAPTQAPRFLHRLLRRPDAAVCIAYLLIVIGVAIVAPIMLPGVNSERAGDLLSARQGPSSAHLLGTDSLGRDILDRLLVGTRVTMLGVFDSLIVALAIGVPLGVVAGFFRGSVDRFIGWFVDLTFSLPQIVILLVIAAVFPGSMSAVMIAFGVIAAPGLVRVVRSAALPVREELYVDAARVAGLSRSYIISRHILPRIAGVIIVQASLIAAAALMVQSGLAFLNLIVAPPAPSWGGMVGDGVQSIVLQPWLIWPPGIAIALTVLALGLLGSAVRDATVEGWSAPSRRRMPRRVIATPGGGDVDRTRPTALLSVEGLSIELSFAGGSMPVLSDVSFSIESGETVAVVGESGCGKTLTAMSILGLLPHAASVVGGRVMFDGLDVSGMKERELERLRGRRIALVSQDASVGLDPAFRVGNQVAEVVRRHHGTSRAGARARALELLRLVRLPEPEVVARRYPHELSGGMAQRVAIARALAGEPKLLIADEPTTALDVTVQAEILDLLREVQAERDMAILLVTHDWGVVADLCDRAVVIYAGQVVEQADVLPIFNAPLHPYTKALLSATPHKTEGRRALPVIPGNVPKPGQWPIGCHFQARCQYATDSCCDRGISLSSPAPSRLTRCIHSDQLVSENDGVV